MSWQSITTLTTLSRIVTLHPNCSNTIIECCTLFCNNRTRVISYPAMLFAMLGLSCKMYDALKYQLQKKKTRFYTLANYSISEFVKQSRSLGHTTDTNPTTPTIKSRWNIISHVNRIEEVRFHLVYEPHEVATHATHSACLRPRSIFHGLIRNAGTCARWDEILGDIYNTLAFNNNAYYVNQVNW